MGKCSTRDEGLLKRPSFHLSLLPWLRSQRILLLQFDCLVMVSEEVDEVNELPLKFQIGLKKECWKRLGNIYFRASDEN